MARYLRKSRAKKALRDPEIRRRVMAELEPAEVEAVIKDANDVAITLEPTTSAACLREPAERL